MALPIKFEQQNVVFAENQEEYLPLPARVYRNEVGEVVSCWEFTDEEIELIIKNKCVYISSMTFNQPLQPLRVTAKSEEVLIERKTISIDSAFKNLGEKLLSSMFTFFKDDKRFIGFDTEENCYFVKTADAWVRYDFGMWAVKNEDKSYSVYTAEKFNQLFEFKR